MHKENACTRGEILSQLSLSYTPIATNADQWKWHWTGQWKWRQKWISTEQRLWRQKRVFAVLDNLDSGKHGIVVDLVIPCAAHINPSLLALLRPGCCPRYQHGQRIVAKGGQGGVSQQQGPPFTGAGGAGPLCFARHCQPGKAPSPLSARLYFEQLRTNICAG